MITYLIDFLIHSTPRLTYALELLFLLYGHISQERHGAVEVAAYAKLYRKDQVQKESNKNKLHFKLGAERVHLSQQTKKRRRKVT